MSIFKCKMCGGTVEFEPGASVGICDSCGTKQTLPRLDDDRRANLYDRANHFRRNNEFDKAAGIYEQILNEDNADAEAYWSLVLCRYGIEYVEDPATRKRVPTVNRAQFTSVFDDDNYKSALQYADGAQRELYEQEAKTINEIQKGILAISQKEEPFDVFICYKETDAQGCRTQDSVLANDLYHQLVNEGFKVFFARITLEDKLGTAYEPYIFAALNSAKVMVVLGTKPEHFNAVWVKNEWSRYLALVKQSGGKKVLIPAYRDMDPYDLPDEFSHLQAQDMSKLGFMQDLIRGIKKLTAKDEPQPVVKETVIRETAAAGGVNVAALLKRAFLFLEDGDWNSADEYCEKVLDQDPENAQAYLGKLLAEKHVKKQEDLKYCDQPFDSGANYQKVLRFGDEALRTQLKNDNAQIRERNEAARLKKLYDGALGKMNAAKTKEAFLAAAEGFRSVPGYRDADALAAACAEKAELAEKTERYYAAKNMMDSAKDETAFKDAAGLFGKVPGFMDADVLAGQCLERAEACRKDAIYASATAKMTGNKTDSYEAAIKEFGKVPGWKDADGQIDLCRRKIEEIKAKEEADRLEREQKRIAAEKAAKKRKKIAVVVTSAVVACIAFVIVLTTVIIPKLKFSKAMRLLDSGEYDAAYVLLDEIGNNNAIASNKYDRAVALIDSGDYESACTLLKGLNYKDSDSLLDSAKQQYQEILLSKAQVGTYVCYGAYEQDNNTSNGKEDIEWLVLAKEDNKALIISKYALDCQPYHTSDTAVTWETCFLRKWLNEEFLKEAFSSAQQDRIISSAVTADKNPWYNTPLGNNTSDKVFLLSITDVNQYFSSDSAQQCQSTEYCYAQGAYKGDTGGCWWWLRSPGDDSRHAAGIDYTGSIRYSGGKVSSANNAVRPAIWINLGD